ncbi:uncharacterized protein LOC107273895 isoform X1 [Cephus cinctus]|uniref:Uncharacterized protein LOC107273895 isoform X1 n=1 Tax=Cephus cinctus TaxID=211228 RepID=A0AAJ7RV08_CEPCN|nr:uncharacterized protein LOC107273895 isoform X1 [Cephus cinctus]
MTMSVKLFVIFLCFFVKNIHGGCYPNFCHNVTRFSESVSHYPCELIKFQRNNNCIDFKFKNLGGKPQDGHFPEKFELNAYVAKAKNVILDPAFNFTVKNVGFHELVMRYQAIGDKQLSVCSYIHLNENVTHLTPTELFMSCQFSDISAEGLPYSLEYLVVGKTYTYSRQLKFIVPKHRDIQANKIQYYTPFIYVDVSVSNSVILYIQPAPKRFNVTRYIVWLISDTNDVNKTIIETGTSEEHIELRYSLFEGVNSFEVAAMHPNCSKNGCNNSTLPYINRNRVHIMIVHPMWSLCAIPFVLLCVAWHLYKLHRERTFVKMLKKKPNCLLVYSPTHESHINVMVQLATYLRSCNINAMIDVLDIPKNTTKNPCDWCRRAFDKADIVIIATSPKSDDTNDHIIYRNLDNYALRLLEENYPRRNKRYLTIQFPYCKTDDIPEEAKHFKRINVPDDLGKVVNTIYNVDMRLDSESKHELLKSIEDALSSVQQDVTGSPKVYIDSDAMPLIPSTNEAVASSNGNREMEIMDVADLNYVNESDVIHPAQYCRTNVHDLCCLGESQKKNEDNLMDDMETSDSFYITQLKL